MFEKQVNHWRRRKRDLGDQAVGRRGEAPAQQAENLMKHIGFAAGGGFYEHALDFGCGWGRFSSLIAEHSGHVWAVDLFEDWVARASTGVTTSPVVLKTQKIPLATGSMDLVVDIMTLQSIDNDRLARDAMHELRRVARPGATIISIHVNKPRAPTRTAEQRATHLGLSNWLQATLTDIDRAKEEYSYLSGVRS